MTNNQRKVFISHSSKDKTLVDKLANDLISHGIYVWYDEWEIFAGHDIVEKVYDGIQDSNYFALVLTQNAIKSKWVKEELNTAKILEIERQNIIVLPLLFEPLEIPTVLKTKKYADFRKSYTTGMDELLKALGIINDLFFVLAKELDNSEPISINKSYGQNVYVAGDSKANLETFRKIVGEIEYKVKNEILCIQDDYRAIADGGLSFEKHQNALLRDLLLKDVFEIALKVLKDKEHIFIDDLESYQRQVRKEFRLYAINEIGTSLRMFEGRFADKASDVISWAKITLHLMIDFQRIE